MTSLFRYIALRRRALAPLAWLPSRSQAALRAGLLPRAAACAAETGTLSRRPDGCRALEGGSQAEPSISSSRRGDAGFTLIELLVVLVILGLLAGLVGPKVLSYLGGSRTKTAKLQIEQLSAALDLYKLDIGTYPDSNQGLGALVAAPAGAANWHGPYLAKQALPNDPWGHPYHYRSPGQHGDYDLYSLGSDNQEGGEGEAQDVTNW
jgi:general secretion pathway protein G